MKLSNKALKVIKKNVRLRNLLALQLDCSVPTVDRWIRENEDNGNLTKATAIQIISEETKLVQSKILEESSEAVSK